MSTAHDAVQIIPGAYYTFDRDEHHCVEGIVYADLVRSEGIVLRDTFWGPRGSTTFMVGHNHLSEAERASLRLLFNPDGGWREATRNDVPEDFDPDDVRRVTSQHGLQKKVWIRDGAQPSLAIRIFNAQERLREARSAAESAICTVEHHAMEVARLVAEQSAVQKELL